VGGLAVDEGFGEGVSVVLELAEELALHFVLLDDAGCVGYIYEDIGLKGYSVIVMEVFVLERKKMG
jgi:hypothetical protein